MMTGRRKGEANDAVSGVGGGMADCCWKKRVWEWETADAESEAVCEMGNGKSLEGRCE